MWQCVHGYTTQRVGKCLAPGLEFHAPDGFALLPALRRPQALEVILAGLENFRGLVVQTRAQFVSGSKGNASDAIGVLVNIALAATLDPGEARLRRQIVIPDEIRVQIHAADGRLRALAQRRHNIPKCGDSLFRADSGQVLTADLHMRQGQRHRIGHLDGKPVVLQDVGEPPSPTRQDRKHVIAEPKMRLGNKVIHRRLGQFFGLLQLHCHVKVDLARERNIQTIYPVS